MIYPSGAYERTNAAPAGSRSWRFVRSVGLKLLRDAIGTPPASFLADSTFSPPLPPRDADEAPDGLHLPACRLHDLGERRALTRFSRIDFV